jgi:hypothetical protein
MCTSSKEKSAVGETVPMSTYIYAILTFGSSGTSKKVVAVFLVPSGCLVYMTNLPGSPFLHMVNLAKKQTSLILLACSSSLGLQQFIILY